MCHIHRCTKPLETLVQTSVLRQSKVQSCVGFRTTLKCLCICEQGLMHVRVREFDIVWLCLVFFGNTQAYTVGYCNCATVPGELKVWWSCLQVKRCQKGYQMISVRSSRGIRWYQYLRVCYHMLIICYLSTNLIHFYRGAMSCRMLQASQEFKGWVGVSWPHPHSLACIKRVLLCAFWWNRRCKQFQRTWQLQ